MKLPGAAALLMLLPATAWAQAPAEAFIEQPVPAEARALGHHGIVMLEGDVSAEGRAINLAVANSSRSPILDALALTRFANVRIGPDLLAKSPKRIRLSVDFNSYDLDHMGMGYLCGQAVLDNDWYAKTFPEGPVVEKSRYSEFLGGAGLIDDRMAFARDPRKFADAWRKATEMCRAKPEVPFTGMIVQAGKR